MSDFVYLYGFVPGDTPLPDQLVGVGERSVRLLPVASLQAVISDLPADQYAPEVLEPRLQDLQWVGAQGVAHERVVAWFVDHAQILPVPLFTMYSSTDALLEATSERMAKLTAEMTRMRGLREWDLKVSFDERELEKHAAVIAQNVAQLDAEIAAASAGRKYLLQKKRAEVVKAELRQAAHQRAAAVLGALAEHTSETRTLQAPRTEAALPVVLHAALLVPIPDEAALIAQLEQEASSLRAIGMDLSFSGPWAPYRFTGEHE